MNRITKAKLEQRQSDLRAMLRWITYLYNRNGNIIIIVRKYKTLEKEIDKIKRKLKELYDTCK